MVCAKPKKGKSKSFPEEVIKSRKPDDALGDASISLVYMGQMCSVKSDENKTKESG